MYVKKIRMFFIRLSVLLGIITTIIAFVSITRSFDIASNNSVSLLLVFVVSTASAIIIGGLIHLLVRGIGWVIQALGKDE